MVPYAVGSLLLVDPPYWQYCGLWEPYLRHPESVLESCLPSPGHMQLTPYEYSEKEGEPDPTVLGAMSASSPDELVTLSSLSPPDEFKQYQNLMHKVAAEIQI